MILLIMRILRVLKVCEESFFHGLFHFHAKLGQNIVQCPHGSLQWLFVGIFAHVADAEQFSGEAAEGACQQDVVLLPHGVEQSLGGGLLRDDNSCYGRRVGAHRVERKACGLNGCAGGFGQGRVALLDAGLCLDVFGSLAETGDVADGHGVREPLILIIGEKRLQIGVEGGHRCLTVPDGLFCQRA